MIKKPDQFNLDTPVSPGLVIEDWLDSYGMSQEELAERSRTPIKLVSMILSGEASIDAETAIRFEKVLIGYSARLLLDIETTYRLKMARNEEMKSAQKSERWAASFPSKEIVKRGYFSAPESIADCAIKLFGFFGVASIDAWNKKYNDFDVAYRKSPTFTSDSMGLITWIRMGQLMVDQEDCADYDDSKFKVALEEIRHLTTKNPSVAICEAKQLCANAGVALVIIKSLSNTALSGAAWWQSPSRAVIQLSMRHKTDDHLWFSFFHEAAHILLHKTEKQNKKPIIFVDGSENNEDKIEQEANSWASDFLIPKNEWDDFLFNFQNREVEVKKFASQQNIAPGIIVGRLQKEQIVPWSHLNNLRVNLSDDIESQPFV